MKKDTTTSTMLVISMGFLTIYLLFSLNWSVYVALTVGVIGVFSNSLSRKIEWLWMQLSRVLSHIVPTILLTAIFYLILFPLSLLSKLFTKDPLMLSNKHESYFVKIEKTYEKKGLENIW